MKKTKEIEVWVHPDEVNNPRDPWFNVGNCNYYNGDTSDMVKARLILEIPERKIEITHSEFNEAFNRIRYLDWHEDSLCPYTVRHLGLELFKQDK